ncbi:MAG: electron transfer flavoprotein subunit alpha/FixB family protein [Synergistaceae bacterium]|jgi:electron transfer flavoprotein alpha subunit|nr:electron transfer flavoprotein subunit alpha/FixB family protein [Synergistaceae bacterium]
MNDNRNIWVFAEQSDGRLAGVVAELLAKARELGRKTGGSVTAILLGDDLGEISSELLACGAEGVIEVESPRLRDYKPVPYASALQALVEKHRPAVLLFGATTLGRDLAPRLQAKLLTGLTADCLDLDADENGLLVQTKPSYGDNIMCQIICPDTRPQMATVRPKVFSPAGRIENPTGQVIKEDIDVPDDENYQVVGRSTANVCETSVADADKIVCIGRGACGEGTVETARDLAGELCAALGVTRPLTDSGQFTHDDQIGQSGTTVKPKLIINFGVSGAVQYTVGMQNSELIVSVNKNEDAPIFGLSHYGYVGDAAEFMTAFLEALKNYRK